MTTEEVQDALLSLKARVDDLSQSQKALTPKINTVVDLLYAKQEEVNQLQTEVRVLRETLGREGEIQALIAERQPLVLAYYKEGGKGGLPARVACIDARLDALDAQGAHSAWLTAQETIREQAEQLEALRGLICEAGPLAWVAHQDMKAAEEWEKKANTLIKET